MSKVVRGAVAPLWHCASTAHITVLSDTDGWLWFDYCVIYDCSTVVLICFTCPAITVETVILRALDRVRERALGCFARSNGEKKIAWKCFLSLAGWCLTFSSFLVDFLG